MPRKQCVIPLHSGGLRLGSSLQMIFNPGYLHLEAADWIFFPCSMRITVENTDIPETLTPGIFQIRQNRVMTSNVDLGSQLFSFCRVSLWDRNTRHLP